MLTAEEFTALQAKVSAEMQRRCYYGSLAGFAGAEWQPGTPAGKGDAPIRGGPIYAEQGRQVIEPLLSIKDIGDLNTEKLQAGERIPASFDAALSEQVDALAAEAIAGSTSSCRGACTGLCVGTCGNGCGGCAGGCSGTCGVTCSSTCASGCTGCQAKCTGSCHASCSASCGGCSGCSGGARSG